MPSQRLRHAAYGSRTGRRKKRAIRSTGPLIRKLEQLRGPFHTPRGHSEDVAGAWLQKFAHNRLEPLGGVREGARARQGKTGRGRAGERRGEERVDGEVKRLASCINTPPGLCPSGISFNSDSYISLSAHSILAIPFSTLVIMGKWLPPSSAYSLVPFL